MSGLTIQEIASRLAAAGTPGRRASPEASPSSDFSPVYLPRGDHDLNPDFYDPAQTLIPAAVLVPIVERPAGLSLLLTRRTDHLDVHAGQISFPGGRVEGDESLEAAALRETEEEVGLPRRHVRLIGMLDTYVTRTGFEVTPVVGAIRPPFPVTPDSFEVAEVFEVPLSFILAPSSLQRHVRVFQGKERQFYAFPHGDYYIWGATAGMLVNLVQVLTASEAAADD